MEGAPKTNESSEEIANQQAEDLISRIEGTKK